MDLSEIIRVLRCVEESKKNSFLAASFAESAMNAAQSAEHYASIAKKILEERERKN